MNRLALSATALAAAVTLAGCGSGGGEPAGAEAPVSGAQPVESAVGALDFTGTTLAGSSFDGASLQGRPAVIWFWAPWCTICRAEAPGVAAVAAHYDEQVTFLGVPGLGSEADMREFVGDTGTGDLTHVVDGDGSLWQRFGVVAQPAFAFVDTDGTVQVFGGSLDEEQLRQAVDELLAN